MSKPGDIILSILEFKDTDEVKVRSAVVVFEELGSTLWQQVWQQPQNKGHNPNQKLGEEKGSMTKLNCIFTISTEMAIRVLFHVAKRRSD